jgi:hypothetical protein
MKWYIVLLAIVVICLCQYGCVQTPGVTNRNGVISAQTDVDVHVEQIVSEEVKISFSELHASIPTKVERDCLSSDNIVRRIDSQVTLPESDVLTRFRLAPVEPDIDQLLSIFFHERASKVVYDSESSFAGTSNYVIKNGDKSITIEGLTLRSKIDSLTPAYLNYDHLNTILDKDGYPIYDPSLPVIDEQGAYDKLLSLLNELNIGDVTVTETSSMDDGRDMYFRFIPRFTEYLVAPDVNGADVIYGRAHISARQVESIYGNFLQAKADEQSVDQLLPFESVVDIVMVQLAQDDSEYEILIDKIHLCHKYVLDEVANTVYAVPVWVFTEKIRKPNAGFSGDGEMHMEDTTQFIVVDAVDGQIY